MAGQVRQVSGAGGEVWVSIGRCDVVVEVSGMVGDVDVKVWKSLEEGVAVCVNNLLSILERFSTLCP